jgi:hypothetical protein
MTPSQINTAARQRYNAVGDDFYADAEIYDIIYQGCCEMATEGMVIEQTYTTTSVASQQEYAFPTYSLNIKRITYNGRKLVPITFREDDILTVLNQATTATGVPTSYAVWNNILYLRPIPSTSSLTIKVWSNIEPGTVTATSTLEIPTELQMGLVNLILSEMSAKNKNYEGATYYRQLWEKDLRRAKEFTRRRKVGDAFNFVKNVDILPQTDLGNV